MRLLAAEERQKRADAFPDGCRVRAVRFTLDEKDSWDDNEIVPPGTEGTVDGEPDAAGTLHVNWDNGRRIGFLIEDQVERIP